jgi:hypothetical protein
MGGYRVHNRSRSPVHYVSNKAGGLIFCLSLVACFSAGSEGKRGKLSLIL